MLLGAGALLEKFWSVMGDLGPKGRESSMHVDLRFGFSGASVKFGGCRTLHEFKKYEGNEYSVIVWDEAQQLDFALFLKMMQRNRSPDGCDVPPRMFLTCNPPQPSEPGFWLRDMVDWYIGEDGFPIAERMGALRYFTINDNEVHWVEEGWRDADGNPPKSFTFVQALATDNPVGLAANPTYMASIRAQTEVDQERLAKGNWNARPGAQLFGGGRLRWIDSLPPAVARANTVRYWDLGGGLNDTSTRNGLGGVRVTIAHCPECDGSRWLARAPCSLCNVRPDGSPYVTREQAAQANRDGALEAVWLEDPIWEQGELGALEAIMVRAAQADGPDVPQYIEEERGNKVATHHYKSLLSASEVIGDRVTGKKQVRAVPLVSAAERGLLFVVRSANDVKVRQAFESFGPDGSGVYKDIIDAASGGVGAHYAHKWHRGDGVRAGVVKRTRRRHGGGVERYF